MAAGRNQNSLIALRELGADATIRLDTTQEELQAALVQTAGDSGFHVVIDYVWGPPTEAFLDAVTKREFSRIGPKSVWSRSENLSARDLTFRRRVAKHCADNSRHGRDPKPRCFDERLATSHGVRGEWTAANGNRNQASCRN